MQNPTDHAFQNHVCCQGGICTSRALESLSPLTGQQMIKRVRATSALQGCQIGFFDANLTNLTFLETVGVKKLFGFFSSIMAFLRQLAHAIRLVSWLFKYLAEKCY